MTRPIILAYDGSDDAKHALTTAGTLLRGRAIVVHVYASPETHAAAPTLGAGLTLPIDPMLMENPAVIEELDDRARERAVIVVQEGVELARAAGFEPEPELIAGDGVQGVWSAIAALADARDASVIVVGHRDVSWLAGALRGSVGTDLVKHVSRPVLVIPAPPE
ncbi:MAG: universal stress protein [Solirubrobacteraceae bacterium]